MGRDCAAGSSNCAEGLKLATDDVAIVLASESSPIYLANVEKRERERIREKAVLSSAKLIGRNCSGGQLQSANSPNDSPGLVTPRRNGDYTAPCRITRVDPPGITPVIHIKHPNKSITRRVYRDASLPRDDRRVLARARREF